MRKTILLALLAFIFQATAQKSQRPQPKSWNLANISKTIPITLPAPNLAPLKAEDAVNDLDKSIPWRFGYDHFVDYGIENAGKWQTLPNGDRIWRINFISPGALTMNLIFDRYYIPIGGKVYIYNEDHSQILNVFTHQHNNPEEIIGTWMLNGENIIIEYFEPKKVRGQARLHIGNVIHGYRTLSSAVANPNNPELLNDSAACNVDVNCDISAFNATAHNIKEDVKKSVAMVVVNGGTGICSGALVNNTSNDGTPYFLTANHCLGGSVAGWAYRFNWASDASVTDCATNAPSVDNSFLQTASGGVLRASNSKSDMALIEITDNAFFNANPDVVWAGWNRSKTEVPSLTVGVHHPRGDIQKVCVDQNAPTRQVITFNGNPSTDIWRIADWDLGVTQPGSSGSPLFNQDGLIVGKLSGGYADCTGTNDNDQEDWYGRFGVSWDFGTTNSTQLKFWLDPAGTNPTSLQQYPPLQTFDYDAAISVSNIPQIVCDGTISPTIRLKNSGSITLTSATIVYQLDSGAQTTINWTGSLATDQFEDITLSPIAVSGQGSHGFSASVSNPNGNADQSNSNNSTSVLFNIPETFQATTITVVITPDGYGAETTWEIKNSSGTVVANGGPYTSVNMNVTQPDEVTDVTISTFDECYTFTIFDSFSDGICCAYGNGTYRLEDQDDNVLINGNGNFGASASSTFKVIMPLSVSEQALEDSLRIYPNPSASDFKVSVNRFANLSYEVSSITGQKLQSGTFTNGVNSLTMQREAAGVYFLKIVDKETNISITKKIIKF